MYEAQQSPKNQMKTANGENSWYFYRSNKKATPTLRVLGRITSLCGAGPETLG